MVRSGAVVVVLPRGPVMAIPLRPWLVANLRDLWCLTPRGFTRGREEAGGEGIRKGAKE